MRLNAQIDLTPFPLETRALITRFVDILIPLALKVAEKDRTYGSSWRKRGGVDSFMMLARKWDRIENQAAGKQFNILTLLEDASTEGPRDDAEDLIGYLLLCLEFVSRDPMTYAAQVRSLGEDEDCEPTTATDAINDRCDPLPGQQV